MTFRLCYWNGGSGGAEVEVHGLEQLSRQFEERGLFKGTLCGQCKHSLIFRRKGQLGVYVRCRSLGEYVPPDVVECNGYEHHKTMDMYEMREIALLVDKRVDVNDGSYR